MSSSDLCKTQQDEAGGGLMFWNPKGHISGNISSHLGFYKENMDFLISVAELGTVCSYELLGSLHGLFHVRDFTQDDAHIFYLEDQIKDEIRGVLDPTEDFSAIWIR
ncbi:hypothetical protein MLD38_003018 [Melastoma candidum]|uniref:Uncharacterized protein n=1 Tax=Melastoma candidum TaxID=119954 RepID=A0ACB9S510_9MYRT|nr:hypothetical protein MLD38_003018 [Melastoma candidum]